MTGRQQSVQHASSSSAVTMAILTAQNVCQCIRSNIKTKIGDPTPVVWNSLSASAKDA